MKFVKGLFWMSGTSIITHKVICDSDGRPKDKNYICTAKNRSGDNHKAIWSMLGRFVTHGKPYNYYPRGRVEIRRSVATVYLNPVLCTEEFKAKIKSEFGLYPENGIKKTIFKADGSRHYRYLEDK